MTDTGHDIDTCPICDQRLKPDDLCATDIEMGTCHAKCLEGSLVVDLETGEPLEGRADTFVYGADDTGAAGLDPVKGGPLPIWAPGGIGDRIDKAMKAYADEYAYDDGESGYHEPTPLELELIKDCISGALAEPEVNAILQDGARACAMLAASPAPAGEPVALQQRVQPWMMACFGPEISADRLERGDRLLEEVLELLQSGDYPRERVAALTDYVYGRPKGEPSQEVGGVQITLAAYCLAHGLDMHEAGEAELARIWTKVDTIRAKQAAKPRGSALPIAAPPSPSDARAAALEEVAKLAEEWGAAHGEMALCGLPEQARVREAMNAAAMKIAAAIRALGGKDNG